MKGAAIITGASRGIGADCAQRLAAEGWAVAVNWHTDREAALKVCADIAKAGGTAVPIGADVSDPAQAASLYAEAVRRLGPVSLLVNNAGIALFALAQETTDAQWQQVFDVNVKAVFHMCRAVIPGMVARQQGHIVNIGSMWGQVGAACESAYSASKAAVIGYTKALAKELGPSGILVNCVGPGFIDTDMNRCLRPEDAAAVLAETPLGRAGTPQDVARADAFFAADDFATGQVLGVSGGLII